MPRYIPAVILAFTPSPPPKVIAPLYPSIFTRKVMRAEFDPERPIPTAIIKRIEEIPDKKDVALHTITDPIRRLTIAEFQGQADGFVINSRKFRRELGQWLLPNDTISYLGMPGVGFGLQDTQAQRIHDGLCGIQPLEPEDGLRFSLAGKVWIEKSPLIGCLTIAKDDPVHWLKTGITLEKIFLTLQSEHINFAIHAGIVEVTLVNRMFAATLGTLRRLSTFFRAGFVKDTAALARPHSPRLPLTETLLSNNPMGSK